MIKRTVLERDEIFQALDKLGLKFNPKHETATLRRKLKNHLADIAVVKFKEELRDLLDKYNACLFVELDGDTHGLSTNFMVELEGEDRMICEGSSGIDYSDLK